MQKCTSREQAHARDDRQWEWDSVDAETHELWAETWRGQSATHETYVYWLVMVNTAWMTRRWMGNTYFEDFQGMGNPNGVKLAPSCHAPASKLSKPPPVKPRAIKISSVLFEGYAYWQLITVSTEEPNNLVVLARTWLEVARWIQLRNLDRMSADELASALRLNKKIIVQFLQWGDNQNTLYVMSY